MCDGDDTSCGTRVAASISAPSSVATEASADNVAFISSWRTNVCAALQIAAAQCTAATVEVAVTAASLGGGSRRLTQTAMEVRMLMPQSSMQALEHRLVAHYQFNTRVHCSLLLQADEGSALHHDRCLVLTCPVLCHVCRLMQVSSTVTIAAQPQVAMSAASTAGAVLALPPVSVSGSPIPVLSVAAVEKVAVCGDGVCAPSETPSATESLPDACEADCPFAAGSCPSPGSLEAGDSTQVRQHCIG